MTQNLFPLLTRIKKLLQQRNRSDVGFIGIGNMGSRMAENLIRRGRTLKVYSVSKTATQSVTGAQLCSSPQEAATDVDFCITMLSDGTAVRNILIGPNGILRVLRKDTILVDSSTIDPLEAQEIHKIAREAGVTFVDAPTSGGVTGAAAGTLTFMIGGHTEAVEKALPYLNQMGTKCVHCGGPGTGQMAKLCNNLILIISMMGVSEGYNLGAKLGMNMKTLASVVNISTGRCWSSDTYNPVPGITSDVPSCNNYEGGFVVNLAIKDLALAAKAADKCGAPILLGSVAHQTYKTLAAHGLRWKDFGVMYKFLQGTG